MKLHSILAIIFTLYVMIYQSLYCQVANGTLSKLDNHTVYGFSYNVDYNDFQVYFDYGSSEDFFNINKLIFETSKLTYTHKLVNVKQLVTYDTPLLKYTELALDPITITNHNYLIQLLVNNKNIKLTIVGEYGFKSIKINKTILKDLRRHYKFYQSLQTKP